MDRLIVLSIFIFICKYSNGAPNNLGGYISCHYTTNTYSLKYIDSAKFKRLNNFGFGITSTVKYYNKLYISVSFQYLCTKYQKVSLNPYIPEYLNSDYLNIRTSAKYNVLKTNLLIHFLGVNFNRAMHNALIKNSNYISKFKGHVDNLQLEYELLIKFKPNLYANLNLGSNLITSSIEYDSKLKTEKFYISIGISYALKIKGKLNG